jgi:hypothetical protein
MVRQMWLVFGAFVSVAASVVAQQTAPAPTAIEVRIEAISTKTGSAKRSGSVSDGPITREKSFKGMIGASPAPSCGTMSSPTTARDDRALAQKLSLLSLTPSRAPISDIWPIEVAFVSAIDDQITVAVTRTHRRIDANRSLTTVPDEVHQRTMTLRAGEPQLLFNVDDATPETACAFDTRWFQLVVTFAAPAAPAVPAR